jgi:hypothetical protein
MANVTHKFLYMYLSLFITLYMFQAPRVQHQERQIVSIQPLVSVTLCWWPCRVQVGSKLPTCTRHGHKFLSPDDEHKVLKTCRVIHKNKYIERNLCVMLVIYQESMHDAWSTKCKFRVNVQSTIQRVITQNTIIQSIPTIRA